MHCAHPSTDQHIYIAIMFYITSITNVQENLVIFKNKLFMNRPIIICECARENEIEQRRS